MVECQSPRNDAAGAAPWRRAASQRGIAMVALLIGISIMAIALTAALPAWKTLAMREREEEMVFRGEQYARAIAAFQRKYAGAFPPTLDVLVTERFLRKKYKDPITGDDFQVVAPGVALPGQITPDGRGAPTPGRSGQAGTVTSAGRGTSVGSGSTSAGRQGQSGFALPAFGAAGTTTNATGIMGVTSKSTATSLRLYNGRDKYNEWIFVGTQASQQAGAPSGGRAGRGSGGTVAPGGGASPRGGAPPRGTGGR